MKSSTLITSLGGFKETVSIPVVLLRIGWQIRSGGILRDRGVGYGARTQHERE